MTTWLRRRSFRTRLGALVAVAVGVTVALAALASYIAVHHQLYSQVDSSLQNEMSALSADGLGGNRAAGIVSRFNNSIVQAVTEDGTVDSISSLSGVQLPVKPAQQNLLRAQTPTTNLSTITFKGATYRVFSEGGMLPNGLPVASIGGTPLTPGTPVVIQIARPLTDIENSLAELRLILWITSLAGIAVAVGLGYLVGRATIRPVERLTAAAEHVAATQDLAARINDEGDDELARLARSFNAMLSALAASRQQQAQLISDTGHELRTPLTSIRTNIEVLLRVKDLPISDRADLVTDVQAQLEEMTTLIGDVVELAREDEGQAEPIEVRLDSIVEHAVERVRRRAPLVAFDVQLTPGSARAQPALLERAVLNVLDNAAKWSPPGGTVRVWLLRNGTWTLDVLDQGPGIAPGDLPHVFDRFYRAEAARSLPGSGLGLAIVQRVVAGHGGNVTVSSPLGGGTLVHIELPIVREQEPEPSPDPSGPSPAEPGLDSPTTAGPNPYGAASGARAEPATPGPNPYAEPATPGPNPYAEPATPGPNPYAEPATPGPNPYAEPATPGPNPYAEPATPGPNPYADAMIPGVNPPTGPAKQKLPRWGTRRRQAPDRATPRLPSSHS